MQQQQERQLIQYSRPHNIQTTSSKLSTFNDTVTGSVDPEFQISKKYPTTGDITCKANLTISVIPPLTFSEAFTGFWDKYGTPIITSR